MALEERHKVGYLTEEIPKSIPEDPQERIWKGEDSLLRSVLINSMEPQIGRPLLYAAIAKGIWDAVQQLYSKRHNASRLYTLWKEAHECKQGTMDVTFYFNKMFLLWQEMDLCKEIVWKVHMTEHSMQKNKEADRIYDFLARLNSKFDAIRSRILGQRPTPSLMEVCSEIRLEEDRSSAINNPVIISTDVAVYATKSSSTDGDKKPTPVCEHHKKPWHTKNQGWKLHGWPRTINVASHMTNQPLDVSL
ncbi:uncharacterized protein LOC120079245 [Benincasa hispida]|uniref:uncharacterized protein LOC120079245 n=1 Tax=Benincasa hispida TaxID=102211 RepID=UPI00190163E5|nr:uncharacterized protein LOC120079245 [Benincasa hispida]